MKLNFFNFKELNNRFLLTNDFGKYVFLTKEQFYALMRKDIDISSPMGNRLLQAKMIVDASELEYSAKNQYQLRDYKYYLCESTSLHIFVVTTACNLGCVYCQANNGAEQPHALMTKEIAEKSVDIALQSPSKHLSFEFQGGEPLLNFEIIKHIYEYSQSKNKNHQIEYNIVSNLTLLTEEIAQYLSEHHIGISTSIDGGEYLHNCNRPTQNGTGSFLSVVRGIRLLQSKHMHVGAIQTTTKQSFSQPEKIVREYVNLGFDSIFVRPLTPLGKALAAWDTIGYTADEFVSFYRKILFYIIEENKKGNYLREEHAAMLMKKIAGCGLNYMELRSPCGAGIGQLAYFADGNVFTCDEGRMMYEMGNDSFLLGNVFKDEFSTILTGSTCRGVCAASVLESIPSCCDCVYQPYCGTCPVVNYALYGDIIEKQPREYKCRIYSGIFDEVFSILSSGDKKSIDILYSWSN